jgi:hypothetical protein
MSMGVCGREGNFMVWIEVGDKFMGGYGIYT